LKKIIILAMHGSPPKDFPKKELMEFFGLHARMDHGHHHGHSHPHENESGHLMRRYTELDVKMKNWPRTTENDPFYVASEKMAAELSRQTGLDVDLGFNEFCAPTLVDAFEQASKKGAETIIVVTPMLTPGGEHAERDIPTAIQQASAKFPHIEFKYAWPFEISKTTAFLAEQINRF